MPDVRQVQDSVTIPVSTPLLPLLPFPPTLSTLGCSNTPNTNIRSNLFAHNITTYAAPVHTACTFCCECDLASSSSSNSHDAFVAFIQFYVLAHIFFSFFHLCTIILPTTICLYYHMCAVRSRPIFIAKINICMSRDLRAISIAAGHIRNTMPCNE